MTCPDCGSGNVHGEQNYARSGLGHTEVECYCGECGCEWTETTTIEITKHGEKEEYE